MKVFLLGSHMNYNLEHYVYMNLVKLGHEVKFYGYGDTLGRLANPVRMIITRSKFTRGMANLLWLNRINEEIKKVAEAFRPDSVLSIKGEAVKPETVEWLKEELGAKTALWYPDDPRFFRSFVKYVAPHYDHVFTASENAVKMYRSIGVKHVDYLPFACEPSLHKRVQLSEEERKRFNSDVCFVGIYYPRRGKIVGYLKGFNVSVYGPYWRFFKRKGEIHDSLWGPEMVKAFNASKIVLNIHIREDLAYKPNMRLFEATGCGAFLLTDRPYGLERLFIPGKEVVCYEDGRELVELVEYYLEAADERSEIALRGQERTYREHTYEQRAKKILELTIKCSE